MIRIIKGDNESTMRAMCREPQRFTLCYADPLFFSQIDYSTESGEFAFSDKWPSIKEYIDVLRTQIEAARALLALNGSLVVHLDVSAVHEAKVMCDRVFGRDHFAGQIIWRYRRWPSKTRNFQSRHDVLLRYVRDRSIEPRFNQLYEPLAASTLEQWGSGKQRAIVNSSGRRVRSSTTEDEARVPLSDVWEIGIVAPSGAERTGYPTQKPEELIERLVLALTNEGDHVLDPFCGSGTVPAVCHRLGRHCVSIDSSPVAIRYANERLAPLLAQCSLFGGPNV